MFSHPRGGIVDRERAIVGTLVLMRDEADADARAVLALEVANGFALAAFQGETELKRQPDGLAKIEKRAAVRSVENDTADRWAAGNADNGVLLRFPAAERAPLNTCEWLSHHNDSRHVTQNRRVRARRLAPGRIKRMLIWL